MVALASCVDASAELRLALERTMSSFEHLASTCRSHGVDPMTMVMTMMGGGRTASAGPVAVPSDTEISTRSKALIEALDRCDVESVAATIAPSFVRFAGDAAIDRDRLLALLVQHRADGPSIAQRTWDREAVIRKDDAIVFTCKARELQAGNETKGGYLHDGVYLLQWVRVGDGWRVQLLTWQKETTDRDYFNEIFLKGRGFSREPNRLLVDAVKNLTPGTALDVATGQGRNALYLASQGWTVTGVDGSEEGLRIAREEADRRHLDLETIHANLDAWDFGTDRYDLVTLFYAGDQGQWIDKAKASLRAGGLFVVEGWAREMPGSSLGFAAGQLANLFVDYEILRDETIEDVPDWAWDKGRLVRFLARKR